jgi:hypothetical protein
MLSLIVWLANKLYAIEEKGKDVANVYHHRPCLLSSLHSTTVQTCIQCNNNSTRSYENQSVYRAVSKLVKTAMQTLWKAAYYNLFSNNFPSPVFAS